MSKLINKGDRVYIRPKWRDPGDERIAFYAGSLHLGQI